MPKSIPFTQLIEKLKNFHQTKKRLPSFAEMQDLFGYQSKGGVSALIPHFIKRGILKKDAAGKLIPGTALHSGLCVLGSIQAGFPSPAEEELLDTLSMDEFLIQKPSASYLIKVSGDSMIEAGIMPGDLVIVERGREAKPGDIVIAQVDGQWTMKYYTQSQGKVILKAANRKYAPIQPKQELLIGGVVIANVRKYK